MEVDPDANLVKWSSVSDPSQDGGLVLLFACSPKDAEAVQTSGSRNAVSAVVSRIAPAALSRRRWARNPFILTASFEPATYTPGLRQARPPR